MPAVALLAGCSAPVLDDADVDVADASGSMTQGIVLVERTVPVLGAPQTNVSAKFMRLGAAADPELAERLVGSTLDLPAVGSCAVLSPQQFDDDPAIESMGAIELVDVGDLTVRADARSVPLAVRAFPDVGDLVSGMFYTSPDATSDLPDGASYVLEGSGSALVDRFVVEAVAPEAPGDVRIGGLALTEGVELDAGLDVSVRWDVQSGRGAAHDDLVYVDVASSATGAVVRCAFADAGTGVVPGRLLRAEVLGPGRAATLAVHRLRKGTFSAPGVDFGEIRFDLSVIGRAALNAEHL